MNFSQKLSDFRNGWKRNKCIVLIVSMILCIFIFKLSTKTDNPLWALVWFWSFFWSIRCFFKMLFVIFKKNKAQWKMSEQEFQEAVAAINQTLKDWTYPETQVDFALNKWEKCLIYFPVWIYKEKTRTKKINYWWLRYRVKIAKWLSYNVWSISPSTEKETFNVLSERWNLYITDQRIIYISDKKTESINLDKILKYEMIDWWVKLYRNTWTTREYSFLWDWRLFPVYMENLLNK